MELGAMSQTWLILKKIALQDITWGMLNTEYLEILSNAFLSKFKGAKIWKVYVYMDDHQLVSSLVELITQPLF